MVELTVLLSAVTVDDPAYFGGHYILENYCAVQSAFDLSIEDWERIGKSSIRGSWCDDSRKEEMLLRLSKVVSEYATSA